MLIAFYIFVIFMGIGVVEVGIYVAFHLKHLPAHPIWMGVAVCTALTLKLGQILGEIIKNP